LGGGVCECAAGAGIRAVYQREGTGFARLGDEMVIAPEKFVEAAQNLQVMKGFRGCRRMRNALFPKSCGKHERSAARR